MKRTWFAAIITVAAGAAFAQSGADVVKSKGCLNCHAVDTKKMGPSFKDIAAKNKDNKGAADAIAAKLKDGKGDWDSTYGFGLGDVHNLIAVAKLAAEYVERMEADVTREG